MGYLIDTNVLSELRKGARADAGVRQWFSGVEESALFVSVWKRGLVRATEKGYPEAEMN